MPSPACTSSQSISVGRPSSATTRFESRKSPCTIAGGRGRGQVAAQPAQAELDRGVWLADAVEVALEHDDSSLGGGEPGEVGCGGAALELGLAGQVGRRLDRVQARGSLRHAGDQHRARAAPALVVEQRAGRDSPATRSTTIPSGVSASGSATGTPASRASCSTCHSRSRTKSRSGALRVAAVDDGPARHGRGPHLAAAGATGQRREPLRLPAERA